MGIMQIFEHFQEIWGNGSDKYGNLVITVEIFWDSGSGLVLFQFFGFRRRAPEFKVVVVVERFPELGPVSPVLAIEDEHSNCYEWK